MPMYSSYSHRSKNRLLVGCLSTLIGGPLLCCVLLGLFYVIFPALEGTQPANLPLVFILLGAGILGLLLAVGLVVGLVYLRKSRAARASP